MAKTACVAVVYIFFRHSHQGQFLGGQVCGHLHINIFWFRKGIFLELFWASTLEIILALSRPVSTLTKIPAAITLKSIFWIRFKPFFLIVTICNFLGVLWELGLRICPPYNKCALYFHRLGPRIFCFDSSWAALFKICSFSEWTTFITSRKGGEEQIFNKVIPRGNQSLWIVGLWNFVLLFFFFLLQFGDGFTIGTPFLESFRLLPLRVGAFSSDQVYFDWYDFFSRIQAPPKDPKSHSIHPSKLSMTKSAKLPKSLLNFETKTNVAFCPQVVHGTRLVSEYFAFRKFKLFRLIFFLRKR